MSKEPIIFLLHLPKDYHFQHAYSTISLKNMRSTSDNDPVKLWYQYCGAAYYGLFLRISGSVELSDRMLVELFVSSRNMPADPEIPVEKSFKLLLPVAMNIVVNNVGRQKVLQWAKTL